VEKSQAKKALNIIPFKINIEDEEEIPEASNIIHRN